MKKLTLAIVALAAMVLASCGGKTDANNGGADSDTIKSFEQEQIEAAVKMHLDSLASELTAMKGLSLNQAIKDGKISLTDEDKKVKPDYLVDPAIANDLTTMVQKYRALIVLTTDAKIAEAYGMDVAPYNEAIQKIAADVNDEYLKDFNDATAEDAQKSLIKLYEGEEKSGRVNLFWQAATAAIVENLYIISQNTDKFIVAFDDKAASDITFRIILLKDAVERLMEYDPQMQSLKEALQPIKVLNATTVAELKEQLNQMKEQLAASRASLLK